MTPLTLVFLRVLLLLPAGIGTAYLSRKRLAMVPLVMPPVLFMYEGLIMVFCTSPMTQWTIRIIGTTVFLAAGVAFAWDLFASPRWYYLKGLSFRTDRETYDSLAFSLRTLLRQHGFQPWQGMLLPQGLIGLAKTDEAFDAALNEVVCELKGYDKAARRFRQLLFATFFLTVSLAVFSVLGYIF